MFLIFICFIYSFISGKDKDDWQERGSLMYYTNCSGSTKIASFDLDGIPSPLFLSVPSLSFSSFSLLLFLLQNSTHIYSYASLSY